MKTKLLIICLLTSILIIQSCDQPNNELQKTKVNYSKFDLFVKNFLEMNPKMFNNDLLEQEGNEGFKVLALDFFNDSLGFKYMPLYVESVHDNVNGSGYVVHMANDNNFNENDISKNSHIDVFALCDRELAESLVQGKNHRYKIIKYHNVTFLKPEMIKYITGDQLWTDHVDLKNGSKDDILDGNSYGNYILEAEKITKY